MRHCLGYGMALVGVYNLYDFYFFKPVNAVKPMHIGAKDARFTTKALAESRHFYW
jgi:hypothetical protein